jgi:hypothetical protein
MMAFYTLALFLHVVCALALGAADALLLVGLVQARRASTVAELRVWSGLAESTGRMIPLVALLLLVPGIYMVVAAWGWATPWIDVALGALVALALLGRTVLGPRLAAVHAGALQEPDGPIPAALRHTQSDPALWIAICTSTALLLGIVFLMTTKPGLGGALATIAVALAGGAAASILARPGAPESAAGFPAAGVLGEESGRRVTMEGGR